MNRGGIGARSLNVDLQKSLSPPTDDVSVERFGFTYRIGDKVMRRGARLNTNKALTLLFEKRQHLTTPQLTADDHGSPRVNAMDLKTFFARSTPIVITSFMDGSYFPVVIENHQFGTSRCRWVGAVYCINSGHREYLVKFA